MRRIKLEWWKLQLTIPVLAKVVVRRIARLARASLIVSTNAELINHLLLETFYFSLRSRVSGFHYFDPIDGELVLHLDGIMCNRSSTIALWFLPFQRHTNIVVVEDFRLTRLVRFICKKDCVNFVCKSFLLCITCSLKSSWETFSLIYPYHKDSWRQ